MTVYLDSSALVKLYLDEPGSTDVAGLLSQTGPAVTAPIARVEVAAALARRGLQAGERVVIYMPHCPQWLAAWLGCVRAGLVPVPVTHMYGPQEVAYIARDSDAQAIFCCDTNFGYVARVTAEVPVRLVVVSNLADLLPWWKWAIGRLYDKIPVGHVRTDAGVVWFRDLVRAAPPGFVTASDRGGDDLLELLYTGGTLGHPKGVPITHRMFLESVAVQRDAAAPVVPPGRDVMIQGAPLYHILGQAMCLGALLSGDTDILLPRLNLDALFDHVQRYRATTLFGTPSFFRMVLEHDRLDTYDLRSLRYVFTGGDVLPPEVGRRWQERFGIPIYQGYGATETCGPIALCRAGETYPPGSAGRVVPIRKVRVVQPETLEPVPAGEPGELLVSSEAMVREYWKKPEETARSFVHLDGRVWYRTGDIVRIDADGWLYFLDRSADVIKHKGYRVAASRVEAALQEHPSVIAACVVGVPDSAAGERIKAFVVLKQDSRGVSAYELIRWCRERLAPYEVPHYIEFRDMLPKSRVGKVLRRELRDAERRKLGVSLYVAARGTADGTAV